MMKSMIIIVLLPKQCDFYFDCSILLLSDLRNRLPIIIRRKISKYHQYLNFNQLYLIQNFLVMVILMQKVQKSSSVGKSYKMDISQIPVQLSYFRVFPYSFDQKNKQEVTTIEPFIITFRDQTISFTEILDRYLKINTKDKRNPEILTFRLSMGSIINKKINVKNLRKQLRRDRIDGINLYVTEIEQSSKKIELTEFNDECGLMDFISQESFDRFKQFYFHFLLPRTSYITTISINPSDKVSQLFQKFVQYLKKNYAQAINEYKFADISEDSIKEYILQDETKVSNIAQKQHISIHQCKHFHDGDMIKVITHDKKYTFVKIIRSDFEISLISKEDNPNLKNKLMKINYDQITDFSVSNLYRVFFLSSAEERQKFDIQSKQNRICLKVLEYILHPDDTLMKIDKGIQKVKTLGDFKLVAYFVTQKMIFYQNMDKVGSKIDFSLDNLNIPENHQNKQIRKKIYYDSQKFLAERMDKLKQLTTQHHFKTPKQVLPIVVYSSELQIVNEQTNKNQTIYSSLNAWLRAKNILKLKAQEFDHWCFKFSSVLYRHLSPIKTQKLKLYRGVTFLLQTKKKEKVTFKNFLSTSADLNFALKFAIDRRYDNATKNPAEPLAPLVLYNISAASGKNIENLSAYPIEKEYLFEPYSQFRLMRKSEQPFKGKNPQTGKEQIYKFIVYDLQEILTPKLMPKTINNYILWIDDKIGESTLIYNQLISEFHYPTVLFQLRSTQDLVQWIKERSMIINDQTKKIIMITNMVRKQNGKPNYYAGADAINIINQAVPNIPIAVYVGDINSALNNMKEKGCDCPNVQVMNTYEKLSQYVSQKIGVKFKRENHENMQIIVSSQKKNDNDGQQSSFCGIM